MKLEFLKNVSAYDEHVMRLSDFNSSQALMFFGIINRLVRHSDTPVDLNTLGFIRSVNCNLVLRTAEDDIGISTEDNINFCCDLTVKSYKAIESLVEPFCKKESKGYQWLYDIDTPIAFLFSAGKDMPGEATM